jgi:hypothetical protein
MKHNLPTTFLFAFIAVTGIIVTATGMRQKRTGDVIIGILMALGSVLIFFL